jgi:NAD(P)H-flavin reductase
VRPQEIHFLYGTKSDSELDRQKILFLPRLMDLVAAVADPSVTLRLFLTGTGEDEFIDHGQLPNYTYGRRINNKDLVGALDGYKVNVFGPEHDRSKTAAYVCGPPKMTDDVVAFLSKQPGMTEERVRCEKWW